MLSVCLLKSLCVAHTKLLAAKSALNEQCKTFNFVRLSLIVMGGAKVKIFWQKKKSKMFLVILSHHLYLFSFFLNCDMEMQKFYSIIMTIHCVFITIYIGISFTGRLMNSCDSNCLVILI